MLLALFWAGGTHYVLTLAHGLRSRWRHILLAALLGLPLLSLGLHWEDASPDDDWQVHAYVQGALASVEPGGLILVRGDRPTFALWYGVYAEGRRADVSIVSGPLLAYIWYREHIREQYPQLVVEEPGAETTAWDDLVYDVIANNRAQRPVYATDPKEEWSEHYAFLEEGSGPIYRVEPLAP
jgi:hypothetical protein